MTRILAIGDIHGCYRSLDALISMIDPTPDDVLVTLGDYVDRGPRSSAVLDLLIELDQSLSLIPLRGNHESMMISARNGMMNARRWMLSGGSETLDSYNGPDGRVAELNDVPKRHWRFLSERLLPYWEQDDLIFVHGSVNPELPMEKQSETSLLWTGFSTLVSRHCSGKTIICGHETQDDGLPAYNEFGVCIDTGAWNHGWLTCFAPKVGQVWQANERGETRQSNVPVP